MGRAGSMYVLKSDKRKSIIHLLIEGNSIRSTERLTRVHRDTIMRLLVEAGNGAAALLDDRMRNLKLRHIEVDEIWTFVRIKQGHIKPGKNDFAIGDQYTFVAIDQDTKLIPSFVVGKRTLENAEQFMLDLAGRIKVPKPGEPKIRLQLSSDGFAAYPAAVDLAFANTVDYGVIIKNFREGQEQPGRYGPPEMTAAAREVKIGDIDPYSICTSYIERQNLTMRTFLRRLTRLSLGFSKKLENLEAAMALHIAHYNFSRRHGTLRMTPAMAAGVTQEMWSLGRLMGEISL
jgi:IS1 family transposase